MRLPSAKSNFAPPIAGQARGSSWPAMGCEGGGVVEAGGFSGHGGDQHDPLADQVAATALVDAAEVALARCSRRSAA